MASHSPFHSALLASHDSLPAQATKSTNSSSTVTAYSDDDGDDDDVNYENLVLCYPPEITNSWSWFEPKTTMQINLNPF